MRDFVPLLSVIACFLSILGVYAALRLNGTEAGVLDELLLLVGGAVAGVATPALVSKRST